MKFLIALLTILYTLNLHAQDSNLIRLPKWLFEVSSSLNLSAPIEPEVLVYKYERDGYRTPETWGQEASLKIEYFIGNKKSIGIGGSIIRLPWRFIANTTLSECRQDSIPTRSDLTVAWLDRDLKLWFVGVPLNLSWYNSMRSFYFQTGVETWILVRQNSSLKQYGCGYTTLTYPSYQERVTPILFVPHFGFGYQSEFSDHLLLSVKLGLKATINQVVSAEGLYPLMSSAQIGLKFH